MEDTGIKKDNFLAISILIASFVIGGSFIYGAGVKSQGPEATAQVVQNAGADPLKVINVSADDDVILGDPNAPVTFIVFGDYQCPFCGATSGLSPEPIASLQARDPNWEAPEPRIIEEYVASGKVRMAYRDFPLDQIHPYARPAAEAAECARDQQKYWAYHDKLFEAQSALSGSVEFFVGVARSLGLNEAAFKSCVESRKYKAEVENDAADGARAGVSGTPGSFVVANNGSYTKFISGAQSYEAFQAIIEEALVAAKKKS
jgi:protein-disulfide isomerase